MPILPNPTGGATWTGNGDGTAIDWRGGTATFTASGTWDGETLTLQYSEDAGTTWTAMGDDTTLTENGAGGFQFGACQLRVNASGDGTTSLTARILKVPRG